VKHFFERIEAGRYRHVGDSGTVYVAIRRGPKHRHGWRLTRNGEHYDSGLESKEHCRQSILATERRMRLAELRDRFAHMARGGTHSTGSLSNGKQAKQAAEARGAAIGHAEARQDVARQGRDEAAAQGQRAEVDAPIRERRQALERARSRDRLAGEQTGGRANGGRKNAAGRDVQRRQD
jgi:hypothetical protein